MKRLLSLLLVLALLLPGTEGVFANKYTETGQVTLTDADTGRTKTYKAVNLLFGGSDVITDIPAILYDLNGKTRTLVPIRFISESLGAQVEWDNDAREATILYKDKVIILKANSEVALVNGEPYTLPDNVPVKLLGEGYNYRTLVPIRFVSEQLGMEVGWLQDTQTVTINKPLQSVKAVTFNGSVNHPELIFKTSGEVEYSSYFLQGKDVGSGNKIVLDLANTLMDLEDGSALTYAGTSFLAVNRSDIVSVEGSQAEVNPYRTRFVINVERKMGYEVRYDALRKEVRVAFNNSVNSITTEKIYNAETVIVHTSEQPTYNVQLQENKVVVDFINAKLRMDGGQSGSLQVNRGGIDSIDYSQHDPSGEYEADDLISRMVVNLKPGQNPEDVYIEDIDNDLYVYVSGNPLDGFDYAKDSLDSAHLNINLLSEEKYGTRYDKNANQLDLTIPKDAMSIGPMNLDVDDNVVKSIDIKESGQNYVVQMKLAKGTIYVDNSPAKTTSALQFVFVNDSLNKYDYSGKLIVIDAGHGGHDPGARSASTGALEKDLALKVAQKLKRKLENIGYKVYMTRDDDTYIGLYNRAEIANSLGADAFVSIHFNANVSATPYGVEMLYVPNGGRDSAGLAQVMQTEVCKATGAYSRGLVQRPNLVVIRETRMPAVLAELGFLSNPSESSKIITEGYQDLLVQGLYNALTKYVK